MNINSTRQSFRIEGLYLSKIGARPYRLLRIWRAKAFQQLHPSVGVSFEEDTRNRFDFREQERKTERKRQGKTERDVHDQFVLGRDRRSFDEAASESIRKVARVSPVKNVADYRRLRLQKNFLPCLFGRRLNRGTSECDCPPQQWKFRWLGKIRSGFQYRAIRVRPRVEAANPIHFPSIHTVRTAKLQFPVLEPS